MIHIGFRFPSGRYHATPWGRHVNEGAIEWPPSPWRIMRALLAMGFTRMHWTDGAIPEDARTLLLEMAGAEPRYYLPPAGSGHSRHYMPKYDGKTTKVFDTFAYLGRHDDMAVVVEYPLDLSTAQREVLSSLLESLPYLGRAESWVSASLMDGAPPNVHCCAPSELPPDYRLERVQLLAPVSDVEYRQWREDCAPLAAPLAGGRKPKRKAGARVDLYPASLLEALCVDTRTLQRHGWSQPPGTRWLSYWLPPDILIQGVRREQSQDSSGIYRAALLALSSNTSQREVLPPLADGIRRAEALHQALVKLSERNGKPSPCFTGKTESGERILHHQHASIYPLNLNGGEGAKARIDHFLVWCPMTFDRRAMSALRQVRRIWAKNLPDQFVTVVGFGDSAELTKFVPQLRQSKVWRSYTPYVAPRFLKRRGSNTLDGQVRAELRSRRLPEPARVEVELEKSVYADSSALDASTLRSGVGQLTSRWRWYRQRRVHEGRQPPPQPGFGLRITFEDAVEGPIALGYGSHFGLGQFIPASADAGD